MTASLVGQAGSDQRPSIAAAPRSSEGRLGPLHKQQPTAPIPPNPTTHLGGPRLASLDELWELPEVQHILKAIRLGTAAPSPPVLIVQAVHDKIIDVKVIDELAETYRAQRGSGHLPPRPVLRAPDAAYSVRTDDIAMAARP